MSEEANKAIVRRYFEEVIDAGDRAVMAELFVPGALQHFPGRDLTFDPGARAPMASSPTMRTALHHPLAKGDRAVAHLTQEVSFADDTRFATQLGPVDVSGCSVHWDAMAVFRLEDGKIAGEWVNRDELSILAQLDAVELKQPAGT